MVRMTNADVLLAAISRHPGATDGELRTITGIEPHQQVNQICRRLDEQGRIDRRARGDRRIGNYPLGGVTPLLLPPPGSALTILPCSKAKRPGGLPPGDPSLAFADALAPETRSRLSDARADVATRAGVDGTALLPAFERYQGHVYDVAGPAIAGAADRGQDLVILSGGFGLLDPREPIAT